MLILLQMGWLLLSFSIIFTIFDLLLDSKVVPI